MKKNNESLNILVIGLILIIIGVATLIGKVYLFKNIANLALILMILITIKDLINFKFNDNKVNLFKKIFNAFISIFAYVFRDYSIAIVPIAFSIYLLINGCAKLVSYILLKVNRLKGGIKELFQALIYLGIGLVILFAPLVHLNVVLVIMGIYSLLLGISFISDYFDINHYRKFPKIKICLPTIIEVIIPLSTLEKFNKMMNKNSEEVKCVKKKNSDKADLEILIHVTEDGYGRLGHMDICFNNEIISFGNYDISSYKFHDIIGNGILFRTKNIKKYLKFCIEDNKKTLFIFGLKLSDKQKLQIKNNIEDISNNVKKWEPPYACAKKKNIFIKKNKYKDYSSRLYRATHANFYKFKTGKYKVFFVLGNNCVSLANKIIGKSLKKSFKFYGIMTPGTYYDYLEREFMKKGSIVVSKKIYNKYNIKEMIDKI